MKRLRSLAGLALLAFATADEQPRRLQASSNIFNKAQLFAHWTSDKINNALPLDLKIDPRSGEGFVVKRDELVSYADMFAGREQRVSPQGATLIKLNKVLDEPEVEKKMDVMKRGKHKHDRELIQATSTTLHLSSIFYSSSSYINSRNLQTNTTDADGFATLKKKPSKRSKKQKIKDEKKQDKNKGNNIHNKNEGGRKKKRKYQPKISNLSPSRGTKISSSQTFRARVLPSSMTNANIRSVSFRLKDPIGETSDWLPVPQAYEDDMYEITIEGFGAFPASKWKYQMSVKDEEGRSVDSPNIMFRVDGDLEVDDDDDDLETLEDDWTDVEDAQGFVDGVDDKEEKEEELMKLGVVGDSNWPHGGGIQSATGRILFEFNGSGTYVCSGTVVKDDAIKGRSVILVSSSN